MATKKLKLKTKSLQSDINSKTSPAAKVKWLTDFKYLFLEQVLQLKAIWQWTLLISILMPLVFMFGFSRIGSGLNDKLSLIYIVTGSATFSVATEGIYTMAQRVSVMKSRGRIIYYASLPISKIAFILALLLSRMLVVSLPGMLVPLLVGPLAFGLELNAGLLWVILLLPLTAISLSAVGMVLGLMLEAEVVPLVANAFVFLMLVACPVFIPLKSLILPLQVVSFLLPPSYAADALRHCLLGQIDSSFYLDLGALVAFCLLSFIGINKFIQWRVT